jgi:DivIVA domain-containing protein
MDGADPEKRIAELERQPAEAHAADDGANRGSLTPDQVRNVAFAKPPLGRRGYHEDEVDAFLDRVAAALAEPNEPHTSEMPVHEESAVSEEPIRRRVIP